MGSSLLECVVHRGEAPDHVGHAHVLLEDASELPKHLGTGRLATRGAKVCGRRLAIPFVT